MNHPKDLKGLRLVDVLGEGSWPHKEWHFVFEGLEEDGGWLELIIKSSDDNVPLDTELRTYVERKTIYECPVYAMTINEESGRLMCNNKENNSSNNDLTWKTIDNTLKTIDAIIKEYGVKYVFIESGSLSIEKKCKELGLNPNNYPSWQYWCELSWGSCDDGYDFAYNSFGNTLSEAIKDCIIDFQSDVKRGLEQQVSAAKGAGIYSKLIEGY